MKEPNHVSISAIILTWNNSGDTIKCLDSLLEQDSVSLDVVIVDNASEDDSLEVILNHITGNLGLPVKDLTFSKSRGYEPTIRSVERTTDLDSSAPRKPPTLIRNDSNIGFGAGCNVGIRYAMENAAPDYVVVANNDTFAENGIIRQLAEFMENNQAIGIAGPVIDWGARISVAHTQKYQHAMNRGMATDTNISGAFLILRTRALHQIGLFDEDYFLYFEETDLFKRCRERGFKVVLVPTITKVFHKSSASISLIGDFSLYHLGRSASVYLRKNHSFEFVSFFVSSALRSVLFPCSLRSGLHLLKGMIDGLTRQDKR